MFQLETKNLFHPLLLHMFGFHASTGVVLAFTEPITCECFNGTHFPKVFQMQASHCERPIDLLRNEFVQLSIIIFK